MSFYVPDDRRALPMMMWVRKTKPEDITDEMVDRACAEWYVDWPDVILADEKRERMRRCFVAGICDE